MSEAWEERLKKAVGRNGDVSHGVVLTAIDKNGERFYTRAAGVTSLAPDAPAIEQNAIYWIASCTKLITSIAVLQSVEKGLITLDEPVSRVLPELATPSIITPADNAEGFELRPATTEITLRHLLTHTSGLAYEQGNELLEKWRATQEPPPEAVRGKNVHVYGVPLLFDPGSSWVYGGSLDWAGELVARLHDTTLGSYFKANIFEPLEIDDTTFDLEARPDLQKRLLKTVTRGDDGRLTDGPDPIWPFKREDEMGGAGLWSSVPDYVRILADLISTSPRLLQRDTIVSSLAAPQLTDKGAIDALVKARGATAANSTAIGDNGLNHGLGGTVLVKGNGILPAGTLMWGGLPNIKWFIHPERGFAAMYSTQVWPHADEKNVALSSEFAKEVVRLAEDRGL